MMQQPLVSIVVITYNSAKYVVETLDSILAQTYPNIQLIVSDDHSVDDTVSIVDIWLRRHGPAFQHACIDTTEKNGGIVANCNRGVARARGSWLKLIAGDDVLLPNCIADNVACTAAHPDVDVLFSRMNRMDESGRILNEYFFPEALFRLTRDKQVSHLLRANSLPAPTAFIRMSALAACGGFDPAFPMMEDLPLWMKLLAQGYRMGGMSLLTVNYRIHNQSVQKRKGRQRTPYIQSNKDFDRLVRMPAVRKSPPALRFTVMVDEWVKSIALIGWLRTILYPALWMWAHCSPYNLPRTKMP